MAEKQPNGVMTEQVNNIEYGPDGAPYVEAEPIFTKAMIPRVYGVMALDLTIANMEFADDSDLLNIDAHAGRERSGIIRAITERTYNLTCLVEGSDGVVIEEGVHAAGFTDKSDLYTVSYDNGRWIVGERVAIAGLAEHIRALGNRLWRYRPADSPLTTETTLRIDPTTQVSIDDEGMMRLRVPRDMIDSSVSTGGRANVEIDASGVMRLLAHAKLGESVCLGPEDPTVVKCDDGTIRMFVTLAVKHADGGFSFETMMIKGTGLHDLEAVGFVPLGTMKEFCFGPAYPTKDGNRRVALGEGGLVGYSILRAATVGENYELDSFSDKEGTVSLFPPNVHDRFAAFYKGTTNTPEQERYKYAAEHISVFNKPIGHNVLPLADGWHVVMGSARSLGGVTNDGEWTMGPFEIFPMVVQLNPNHKYAGQCIWMDDRPLVHLKGAKSITFGSDWYMKQDGAIGMDRTIVFVVHKDDEEIYLIERPLREIWERVPDFLRELDEARTAEAAEAVIAFDDEKTEKAIKAALASSMNPEMSKDNLVTV